MISSEFDQRMMRQAIELAGRGLYTTRQNPRVGCVIAKEEVVLGQGWHVRSGEAHAEVNALRQAGENARGATAYVTLEPCSHHGRTPPCADALIQAGITRVVVAGRDPNPLVAGRGLSRLREHGVTVSCGVCSDQASALNPGFRKRMTETRPMVRLKLAASLDGRTALRNGQSKWITGSEARRDVQHWRARSCAILTGIGTVLADDPRLTVRVDEIESSEGICAERAGILQPLRVVLDSRLRLSANQALLREPGETVIFTTLQEDDLGFCRLSDELSALGLTAPKVRIERCESPVGGQVDLGRMLRVLGERGVNEVHVESGARLGGALVQAGLVDELLLYLAPCLLGDDARGLLSLTPLRRLQDRFELSFINVRPVGQDLFIRASILRRRYDC